MKFAEVEAYVSANGLGLLDEHRGLEEWVQCDVDPYELRDMHGVFERDGVRVVLDKGRRFGELIDRLRTFIEADEPPFTPDIRQPWRSKPRIVVQRSRSNGMLYVADGEKRTFNALYNGDVRISALVVTVDQDREALRVRLR